jgi:LmbE family N-acetylglucosaminyl deacetylase
VSVLVLAPHCDDAPLSLGAALAAGALGHNVTVAVIFTQSQFTLHERGTAPLAATSRLRMAEERAAAAAAGYRVLFLPFAEASARPGLGGARAILDPGRDPRADPAWPCVRAAVAELARLHGGPVLAPLGCTPHVDHRMAVLAAREALAAGPAFPLLFYEELPYAARLDDAALRALLPHPQGAPGVPRALGGELEAKLRLLAHYPSQMDEATLGGVRRSWRRAGAERVWGAPADLRALGAR